MSNDSKKSEPNDVNDASAASEKKATSGKPGKREPYVSRFKKQSSGFGASNADSGGKSGYRGPSGPVGIHRPRGANRGS